MKSVNGERKATSLENKRKYGFGEDYPEAMGDVPAELQAEPKGSRNAGGVNRNINMLWASYGEGTP